MQRLAATLLGLGLFLMASAQTPRLASNVSVLDFYGNPLPQAWAGGNSLPQYSDVDLNGDGFKDLVVFDRIGYFFTTYLNDGNPGQIGYTYAPEYMATFADCDCREWALMVDYNCDGREDIFCGNAAGQQFTVYENVPIGTDSLEFVERHRPLTHPFGQSYLELYVTRTDIPAIVDVDYDGDIDIISTQPSSNRWALYRNRAVEDYGRCDTLVMDYETFCWGHFGESLLTNELILADTFVCPRGDRDPNPGGSVTRHEGGTILVLDTNGDSLMEALITDVSYRTAILAINQGTVQDALMVAEENYYPQLDSSIYAVTFPAAFHLDINNDNIRDLLIAPNASSGTENVFNTVAYLNYGQDEDVDFRLEGRDFLPAHQIDVGSESVPLFWDYNADGLQDLLIGSDFKYWLASDTTTEAAYQLHLFQNVGDSNRAIYQLVDSNYLNFRDLTYNNAPLSRAVPAVGDLDGDGDEDLLFGTNSGRIYHFENTAGPGNVAQFVPANPFEVVDQSGQPIDPISSSAPELYDLDGDGDQDLLVGSRRGELHYYENTSAAGPAIFTFRSDYFGKVKPKLDPVYRNENYSKPRFVDTDGDGNVELLVGEISGRVEIYDNPQSGLTDSLLKTGELLGRNFSRRVAVDAAVIDSTGEPTYVVGNQRGGLLLINSLVIDTTQVVNPVDTCLEVDQIAVNITASDNQICLGDTVTLSASSTGDSTSFRWLPRVSLTQSTGAETQAFPQFTTTYLLIGEQGGCTANDTLTVAVGTYPSASPSANATLVCTGQDISLVANAIGASDITWLVDGVDTESGESTTLSFSSPGVYDTELQLSSADGCDNLVSGPSFRVVPRAKADFTVSPDPSGIIPQEPGEVSVSNQSQNAIEYFWDFGDGTSSVFANLSHTYDAPGTYTISLMATDEAGCTDTATVDIELGQTQVYLPNVFTPNNDGHNDHFKVVYNGSEAFSLLIVDRYGRGLYEANTVDDQGWDGRSPNGKSVPEGVYFFVVRIGDEVINGSLNLLR